jgi:hypothetical protein
LTGPLPEFLPVGLRRVPHFSRVLVREKWGVQRSACATPSRNNSVLPTKAKQHLCHPDRSESNTSVIPTEAKRSGGTLCFRTGAKSILFKQAQT